MPSPDCVAIYEHTSGQHIHGSQWQTSNCQIHQKTCNERHEYRKTSGKHPGVDDWISRNWATNRQKSVTQENELKVIGHVSTNREKNWLGCLFYVFPWLIGHFQTSYLSRNQYAHQFTFWTVSQTAAILYIPLNVVKLLVLMVYTAN